MGNTSGSFFATQLEVRYNAFPVSGILSTTIVTRSSVADASGCVGGALCFAPKTDQCFRLGET
jgi:hypothetical protein